MMNPLTVSPIPLSEVPVSSTGTIVSIRLESEAVGKFMGMGLFPGAPVTVLVRSRNSRKPILISVGDTRIAMGEEFAKRILIELPGGQYSGTAQEER